ASKVKPFAAHLDSYMQEAKGPQPSGEAITRQVGGKLITVDMDKREVDYLYFDLPDDLRAETPDEVGAVVQLRWGKMLFGKYENGTPGYKQTCQVVVKDKATGELLARGAYMG